LTRITHLPYRDPKSPVPTNTKDGISSSYSRREKFDAK
jgi:hypothetical protein